MKHLAALTLAAMIAAGSATTASAFFDPGAPEAASIAAIHNVGPDGIVYDDCHGRASGTAHALCGTLTGGPSGSLF